MRVVAAFDKFRGTATAAEAAEAVGQACWQTGHDCVEIALADGGEGLLDVLGGPTRTSRVTGPLGETVDAPWRLHRGTAVIEMARASGLELVGGASGNDPMLASSRGTGELIDAAVTAGASKVIVGLGGSATTDGGLGAVEALSGPHRLRGIDVQVACDVTTRFVDAAAVFAPQKGASTAQVRLLTARLEQLADRYEREFGVDVRSMEGAGAAGGLGGALAALGANLLPGFDLVADETDLDDAVRNAELVVTGEGRLDEQSFTGKVVGGVTDLAAEFDLPVVAIVGDRAAGASVPDHLHVISLTESFGLERAMRETRTCIELAARSWLENASAVGGR